MTATTAPTASRPATRTDDRGDRLLFAAAALFTVAVLVHNGDHLRRGFDAVATDVFVAGTAGIVLEVGIVVLACARHRATVLAATVIGLSLAAAYVFVHFTPARSWLSDSFPSGVDVSPMSWFAAGFEVTAATVLALAGWTVLRQRGGLASAAEPHAQQRPLREGLLHPMALVFLVANLVVVALSLTQI